MCNKEQLVGYLYGELDAAERNEFDAHLTTCAECHAEVVDLRGTRQHLTTWAPPQPEFNFHIVRGAAPAVPPRRRFAFVPQWAMAAAASLLVLAGAAALAHVELQYGPGGFVVRTGWASAAVQPQAPAEAPAANTQAGADVVSSEQLKAAVHVLESRLLELERGRALQTTKAAA